MIITLAYETIQTKVRLFFSAQMSRSALSTAMGNTNDLTAKHVEYNIYIINLLKMTFCPT